MMKRYFTVLFIALFTFAGLHAQTFRASVLAGVNLNQIDGDQLFGFHQAGVNAGIRVVAVLNERWRVGPELLFTQHGARRNINISMFDRIDLNTLEIPLMVYYKDWRLTAEAGFSYQRQFSSQVTNIMGEDITNEVPIKEDLVAFNAGLTFFITSKLGFNFRWSKHLIDINEPSALVESWRGRTISLRAVYTFGSGETIPRKPDDSE